MENKEEKKDLPEFSKEEIENILKCYEFYTTKSAFKDDILYCTKICVEVKYGKALLDKISDLDLEQLLNIIKPKP